MNEAVRRFAAAGTTVTALGFGAAAWAASSASAASLAVIPRCSSGQLGVWVNVDSGSGAAGSIYYNLDFTNTSGTTCHLYGYPGVAAFNSNGGQMGDGAAQNSAAPASYVNIPAGGSAHAVLRYVDVVATSPDCKPSSAAFLQVIPPGSTGVRHAFFGLPACTVKGYTYLQIQRVQPGA
jgi:hypothetical protein